jgi:hypothetical protein
VGGRWDGQLTNERTFTSDWNPVWNASVGRFDNGWTVEMAIPFKSLRYQAGSTPSWRFNARRTNRWRNEISFLTRIPASLAQRGLWQTSLAAGVVGLRVPSASRNIDIKPYAVSGLSSDMRKLLDSNDPRAALAIDLYVYRISRELGSLAAALGGLDALIFTAGIGENSAAIRERVCRDAAWTGLDFDAQANADGKPCISASQSRVSAWVVPTNEELMIARHTQRLLGA